MEWRIVDRAMRGLARDKASYDADEARWLVEAARVQVWIHVGLGTMTEYLERLFGYTPRQVAERMRVAIALESLPRMSRALGAGELSWSAVRELSRIANCQTEADWIDAARGKTVREVEFMVAGHQDGDRPTDPTGPIARVHHVRYEVSGETFAALRQARQVLELEVGHSLEDEEFVRLMANRAVAGTRADGNEAAAAGTHVGGDADKAADGTHVGAHDRRPRTQILMTICAECGAGAREGAGLSVPVDPASVERALCDARILGTDVDAPEKMTAAIPEPTRRYIYQRDHGCCVVPGCRAAKYLEIHHIVPRADGGSNDRGNLVLLCGAHHDRVHEGKLRIEGTAPDNLRFLRANGSPYGLPPTPDHRADAERALRELGFDKAFSRRAAIGATGDTLDAAIRSALQRAWVDAGLGEKVRTVLAAFS